MAQPGAVEDAADDDGSLSSDDMALLAQFQGRL